MSYKASLHSDRHRIELNSSDRWGLHCRVERIGEDLLCRLSGGEWHVGAVALAQWKSGRAHSECLSVAAHRERELAIHTAHRLCKASRRPVVCIAGIHFDDLDAEEVRELSRSADKLSKQAARAVEQRRQLSAAESSPILERICDDHGLESEIEAFLAQPMDACAAGASPAGEIELFAPLYLSNACQNDCAYCGFRRSEHFPRTTLDRGSALTEAQRLVAAGHGSIELVTGEVATDAFVEYIADLCEVLLRRHPHLRIGLNVGALGRWQYGRLRRAGAIDARIFQETYDPQAYFAVHRGGPKREFAERLQANSDAASQGFPSVGLGILLGLAPLATDLARLVRHGELLQEDYPELRLDFSLPRIRPLETPTAFRAPHSIDDDRFVKAYLFLRRRFPGAELTLSTRERPELRDALLSLGISRISAGVSTAPGGYSTECAKGVEQFRITDERDYEAVAESVRHAGGKVR